MGNGVDVGGTGVESSPPQATIKTTIDPNNLSTNSFKSIVPRTSSLDPGYKIAPAINGRGKMLYVMVGLDGLEPTTSVLSGPRSSRLSYRPTLWVMAKSHFRIIATGVGSGKLNHETSISPQNA